MGGVFFVKKWTFPQHRVHYVQSVFFILHFIYWGCVRTPRTYGRDITQLQTSLYSVRAYYGR